MRYGGSGEGLTLVGTTEITAWTHRACPRGAEAAHLAAAGWRRVAVPGRTWRSGAPMMTWIRDDPAQLSLFGAA